MYRSFLSWRWVIDLLVSVSILSYSFFSFFLLGNADVGNVGCGEWGTKDSRTKN
jgi:hypothetical protein